MLHQTMNLKASDTQSTDALIADAQIILKFDFISQTMSPDYFFAGVC